MKPGSKNVKDINKSIKRVESLTDQYKKKRISTENFIKEVHISLSKMTSERDYVEYLSNIGQI